MGRKKMMARGKLNWKTFHLFCFLIITWCSGRGLEKYKLIKHVGLFYAPCPGPWLLDTTRPCFFLSPACVSPLLAVLTNQCCCCGAKNLPRKNCAIKQCRIVMTIQTLDTRSRARVLQICIEHRCRLKQNHGKCCKWLWIFRIVAVQNVFWILLHVYFYDSDREKHLLTSLSCLRNEESAVNIIIIIILMAVASLPVDAVLTLLTVLVAMNITGDRLWVWWGEGTMATRGCYGNIAH